VNTIRLPSAENAGSPSSSVTAGSTVRLSPSASTIAIRSPPSKTMRLPSGEYEGPRTSLSVQPVPAFGSQ
jgi:hypothetical protein